MTNGLVSFFSYLFPPKPGQSEDYPLEVAAVPGLTTLLDTALFRSNEGQLTGTICSSHALLACWLDVKQQSQIVLHRLMEEEESSTKVLCESFVRQCLESAMDAIERLSTEKLSQSANLSDPYESISSVTGGHHTSLLSGVGTQGIVSGILDSKEETGRRTPIQRPRDCWESPRLHCPDHVWAEDAYSSFQRSIRNLAKHSFVLRDQTDTLAPLSGGHQSSQKDLAIIRQNRLSNTIERQVALLIQLVQDDLPMRLFHFRQAMEAESVVTKRLYLVKCEYRAPLRAFLESHQSLLRAPPMELVEYYLQPRRKTEDAKKDLQSLLTTPDLVEVLALEKECETLELDLGQALFPFSEFARSLDHKKARLKVVPGVVDADQLRNLQEIVRRLKCILCRKGGAETSTGIRPILLDLQLVPRDDELHNSPSIFALSGTLEERVDQFLSYLQSLSTLLKTKNAFWTMKSQSQNQDIDFSFSILKGCTEQFDPELMKCQLLDWFEMVERQHSLIDSKPDLPEQIREAEMAMSLAGATDANLKLVKERLEKMKTDRRQRLEVLKELVEDLCLREMHLYVNLKGPEPTQILVLKETSALGFFGIPLQMAGEPLPVG